MAIELTDKNFKKEALDFEGVVLVDFWAPWCGPCQMIAPIVEELSDKYKEDDKVRIGKVNVDDNPSLAQEYGIMSIPTMKILKNGKVVDEIVGMQSKEDLDKKLSEYT